MNTLKEIKNGVDMKITIRKEDKKSGYYIHMNISEISDLDKKYKPKSLLDSKIFIASNGIKIKNSIHSVLMEDNIINSPDLTELYFIKNERDIQYNMYISALKEWANI